MSPGAPASCSLCGRESLQSIWTGRDTDHLLTREFTLYRCASCGLGQVFPLPSEAELVLLYPPDFYRLSLAPARRGLLSGLVSLQESLGYHLRFSHVGSPRGSGRLLDVGCGNGRFLAEARSRGWQAQGVELSGPGARMARERSGATIHEGTLQEAPLEEGSFEVVTMWHSLEHMVDYRRVVQRGACLLEPGGKLVIAVPDFDGMEARLFLSNWGLFDVPRHVVFLTPRTLATVVREAGLTPRGTGHFSFEFDLPIALQNVLNLVCTERMFLYKVSKREYGRDQCLDPSHFERNLVASVLGAMLLGPPAILSSLLFSALGRGTTITMVATRA